MTQQHIKWHYVPPHASHMAGAWERLIGSTKRILRALADQQRLTDESLLSFMCEAERIMNDRPITSSDDPNSPPLTPSMLLTGRNNQTSLPPGIFEERDTLTRRWWRQVQYLSDVFWKRWLREYLPALQCRSKWTKTSSNLKPNDLVLVVDESTSRGNWPLGVVDSVKTSDDGLVRSVDVRTSNGVKRQPITSLVRLEND